MNTDARTSQTLRAGLVVAVAVIVTGNAAAKQVRLDVDLGTPVVLAGQKQTAYLRVAMTGFELEEPGERPPVNVAIVLDKSGSMQREEKMEHAKEAALMAISRLRYDDIVSVVAYDSTVHVLVPATKLSDPEAVRDAVRRLCAGGNTALFGGVSKGAAEVHKFLDKNRVNRVILLSDGLANVGPSSTGELGDLAKSLRRDGISVTTIGLGSGYNEDLMSALAEHSDGNHMFAENAQDLEQVFAREFGDVLSVVAQDVTVTIHCAPGVRPIRILGRDADILGQTVTTSLNQLYSDQMKYVLVEVELPPGQPNAQRQVAAVDVSYANMATRETERLQRAAIVAFTESPDSVEKNANKGVMVSATRQIGAQRNTVAVKLRDEGKVEEAKQLLIDNVAFLEEEADKYDSDELKKDVASNAAAAENLQGPQWNVQRKKMVEEQYSIKKQQLQQPQTGSN